MGALSFLRDRLTNVMSGMGTTIDRRTAASYVFNLITAQQAEAAYRSSWLVRKIVDIPPLDMTREWRDWQAEGAQIEPIEEEEKRLGVKPKCKRALILARLYGGGALIVGTGDSDPMQPLDVEKVGKGGFTYLHVMSPQQLSLGQPIMDPEDPWFGKPEYFEIQDTRRHRVKLHPSRVIEFVGQKAPEGAFYANGGWFWGDPIMQSIGEAVKNADLAQDGFAALIDEAKLDVIKFPNLTSLVQTSEGETRLLNRLAATAMGKSTWRTVALDKEDEWQQRQVSWDGMPTIIESYLNIVAGAADIPVTRLLGQSPKGLQSTGDGEERDYHAMVKARQDELLCPALDRIDELLIRSALGSRPEEIYYEFAPLTQMSEKDASEIEKRAAETVKMYADTGLIPDMALAAMAKNRIVEGGRWPGSEAAFEEAEKALEDEPPEDDGDDLLTAEERAEKAGQRKKKLTTTDYSPDQPRDPGGEGGGQWVEAGGGVDDERYDGSPSASINKELAGYAKEIDQSFIAREPLTDEELATVKEYAHTHYQSVNLAARSGDAGTTVAKEIALLDSAIAKERLAADLILYRGLRAAVTEAENLPVGTIISDPGFSSTSASEYVGAKFASWAEEHSDQPILLRIIAPKGANALHLHPQRSFLPMEHEVLLPRGARLRIASAPIREKLQVYGEPTEITVVDAELLP